MKLDTETIKRLAVDSGLMNEHAQLNFTLTHNPYTGTLETFANSIAALTTELNEIDYVFSVDKADAERYSYIRQFVNDVRVVFGTYPNGINIHSSENNLCGTALDEKIDEAMKGK